MDVIRTIADLRRKVSDWHRAGLTVGVVPTMGGLHDGHMSLLRRAQEETDRTIVTIFVNPTQFGTGEDLSAYPRDEAEDLALIAATGGDLVFAPDIGEVYPRGFGTSVVVDGLTNVLCGAARPGHFDGVTQVVAKLLNQTRADAAFFGEKDWQQLQVVTKMARDLDFPTRIIPCPTARDPDGLALSTRNGYLSAGERQIASALYDRIIHAAARVAQSEPTELVCAEAQECLVDAGFTSVDYLECRDEATLRIAPSPGRGARIFVAARLGRTRLIDNVPVPSEPGPTGL